MTPPELDPLQSGNRGLSAGEDEPHLLVEAEGSMWASLIANLRDVFSPVKQPPLQLTSKPIEDNLIVREEPIWKTLGASVQDLFFPRKLPPLQLTSQPVAVIDPMAGQRRIGPGIAAIILVVGSTVALLLWVNVKVRALPPKAVTSEVVDLKPYTPIAPPKMDRMGGGGGGGDRDLVQVSKGKLPKLAKEQITPPQIIRNDHPKLAVEPTIVMPENVPLPNANMPNLGLPTSTQVQLASNGTGSGAGMGSGKNGGLGSGTGGGYGPGSGGGTGGGVYHVGGGVSPPTVLSSVDPEYSDEARRAKYTGIVVVSLIVDPQGNPQHVRVVRALGMGLDEKAVEAVRQYKFKPAMFQGKAVPVEVNIEVNFQIY
ncbi:energy transducer TonB [Acidisarcina polymorpha]|uniref:energy transducer TonB n=1 Tax=Acidisarcina polymorpha TaxID=2211140 RepID=UPI001F236711|nr:energy transducer TonB [Acidisarcina polymorpha]